MKERSLTAFTLLAQAAVGALWTMGALHLWAARTAGAEAWFRPALWLAGALMVPALGASFLHLGRPGSAWRAPANARTSWLSREILSALLLTALSLTLAGLSWFQVGPPLLRALVHGAAALAGLALLVCMSSAYRLRTVPAWNHWATPVTFFLTALLLGGLVVGVTLAVTPAVPPAAARAALRGIALSAVLLLGLQMIVIPQWIAALSAGSEAAAESAERLLRQRGALLRGRLGLAVLGIGAAGMVLLVGGIAWVVVTLVLVSAAEVCGRLLFYQARVREGL